MNFKNINNMKSKFNIDIVKKIFSDVEELLKQKLGPIHMAIREDNKEFIENSEYLKILNAVNMALAEDWIMEKSNTRVRYSSIGSIGLVSDGKPDVVLYMALKALKTHNNIVFYVEEEKHQSTDMIIKIVKKACEVNKYNAVIDYIDYTSIEELNKYVKNIDLFIFISKYEDFKKFKRKNPEVSILYSSYGTMSLYLDDKDLKDTLLQMDEYVYNNNIELDLLKDMPVKEAIETINSNEDNYCSVIFTKDSKKAYEFVDGVKSKQIFINRNPGSEYKFQIDDSSLVIKKEIFL
ncbi:MAG: hypothetical protein J6J36_08440 [Clostridia bacterium]|nr:hypothetical protein [Clostridia bacterium]